MVESLLLRTPPSTSEQSAIAGILDGVDEAIRETEGVLAKLKLIKAGLLHDLLTLGLDDHGQLRDPLRHPELFQQTEFGLLPKLWTIEALGCHLIGIESGSSPDCPAMPAGIGEWGVLKVSAIRPEGFAAIENKVIRDRRLIEPNFEVRDGDLLMSRSNTTQLVGLVCLVQAPRPQLMLCDKTLRLLVATERSHTPFVFHCLQTRWARQQIEVAATGSSGSMKNISQKTIRSLRLPFPKLDEQQRIEIAVHDLEAQLRSESENERKLVALKHGLAHDLLSGRVRVRLASVADGQGSGG